MKILLRFLDRIFFAAGVILFLQLPNFIDQYTQRYGGYYEAQQEQLENYGDIAAKYFDGDINRMVDSFKEEGNNPAIKETGRQLEETLNRIEELREGRQVLEEGTLLRKIGYIVLHPNWRLLSGTWSAYKPGMPFTMDALLSGIAGGLLFGALFSLLRKAGFLLFSPQKRHRTDS
ncbi:MAG: DUF2937 family protein [Bacteroidales bacterium]|nr:DUF2937 family protein [Bacteroidales bacterium]